jgi:hypothetical protein
VVTLARRFVALLVLVVLCAAPALATTCEWLCDATAREAAAKPAHHGASCHEAAPVDGPQVSTGSADCAFHQGGASAVPAGATLVVVRSSRPWLAPPPGPPPSSHRPLVLRI